MSTGKHTAGPWSAVRAGDCYDIMAPDGDSDPWHVAVALGFCGEGGNDTDANARLIAAAPDLLAELLRITDHLASWQLVDTTGQSTAETDAAIFCARALIAKAAGTTDPSIGGSAAKEHLALSEHNTSSIPPPAPSDGGGKMSQVELDDRLASLSRTADDLESEFTDADLGWLSALGNPRAETRIQLAKDIRAALADRDHYKALAERRGEALARLIEMDDDAREAEGKPGATLNGMGLTDMFDSVGHPFGVGKHKQQACRSVNLEVALTDARAAIAASARTMEKS